MPLHYRCPPPEHLIPTVGTKGPVSGVTVYDKIYGRPGTYTPTRTRVQPMIPVKQLYIDGPHLNFAMGWCVDA